ncbi:MAG: hypothetical protein Q7S16_02445 [bacterium]|nr:hypothetical protein [bacterium]
MKKTAKKIYTATKSQTSKDVFADFFLRTPIEKQTEVLREVARKANADQRDLMKRYEKIVGDAV